MEMKAVISKDMLRIALVGELDHHCAASIRDKIDTLLCDPSIKTLVFDLKGVSFMDSSGIGVILARAAAMKRRKGGKTVIVKEAAADDQISMMDLTGQRVCDALASITVETLTPIEAMNELYKLKRMLN
jgi:stage II sporulation protein AA (anti-sigma F factor antagonist)